MVVVEEEEEEAASRTAGGATRITRIIINTIKMIAGGIIMTAGAAEVVVAGKEEVGVAVVAEETDITSSNHGIGNRWQSNPLDLLVSNNALIFCIFVLLLVYYDVFRAEVTQRRS